MIKIEDQQEPYILIVEDSLEDIEITTRSLRQAGFAHPIHHMQNGDLALNFLVNADLSEYPSIILLDLNMPGTDGLTVLDAIKKNEKLKSIPVIILTTSNNQKDVIISYNQGANSYIQKPMDFYEFIETARSLKEFWFDKSLLPTTTG
jgi:CheY-like chemotaxis protein